jgi:hypothetical protein
MGVEMVRTFRVLALAAGVLAVFGACLPSLASAGSLTSSKFSTGLHGTQVPGEEFILTLTDDNNLEIHCPEVTYSGNLSATSSTFTVHPEFKSSGGGEPCRGFLGIEALVNSDSCNFEFHIGGTTGSEGHYGGTVDIVKREVAPCGIVITAATCQVKVDSQFGLGSLTFINMGGTDVTVKHQIQFIHFTVTNDGLFCPLANGKTTGVEGDFTGNLTLQGSEGANLSVEM